MLAGDVSSNALQVSALVIGAVGVFLTGLYVAATFKLVGESRGQVRSANMPHIAVTLAIVRNTKWPVYLKVVNDSHLPALDLDVGLFATHAAKGQTPEEFRARFIADSDVDVKLMFDDEVEDSYFVLQDHLVRNRLPAQTRWEAPLAFSEVPDFVYVAMQYRSPLGVNYGQLFQFGTDSEERTYGLVAVEPPWPRSCRRVELFGNRIGPRLRRLPAWVKSDRKELLKMRAFAIRGRPKEDDLAIEERGRLVDQ